MKIRVGNGYDVHVLAPQLDFWLGGIKIEHEKGCVAHSDGDVLIHAICDALLGAAALGDIGYHFPDNDNAYKNIDSKILLQNVVELIAQHGYSICNIDSVVCLQRPKIKDYIPVMRETLAKVMNIPVNDIAVKATTSEKIGFVGREEGVSAYAVVLLSKAD